MLIKGFQATTLVDYPGEIAAIVFVAGCDFRCPYCYNKLLVLNSPDLIELDEDKIIEKLVSRKKLLDGVVISGGEPVLQKDLPLFIEKIKELGLKVKLDTNGTNPDMIQELVDKNLIDFIAMDIKATLNKYNEIAGVKVNLEAIKKSAELIMQGKIDYEFRTTALPDLLTRQDLLEIGKWLKGAKKYCLQQFKPMPDMIDSSYANKRTYTLEELKEIKESLSEFFKEIEIRS